MEKLKNFILNLQELPDGKKKVIFFAIMGVSVLLLLVFAFQFTKSYSDNLKRALPSVRLPELNLDTPQDDFYNNNNIFYENQQDNSYPQDFPDFPESYSGNSEEQMMQDFFEEQENLNLNY